MTEAETLANICEYLTARRIFHWRQNNTGKMPGGRYASVKKGVSDIIALKRGMAYFIEVKKDDGRLSEEQAQFGIDVTKAGHEYIVARSVDDLQKAGL